MDVNIRSVKYTETSNGIKAEWLYSKKGVISSGTGEAIRLTTTNPQYRFEGKYEVIYTDSDGSKSPKLKMDIIKEEDCYSLKWLFNNEITEIGIGFESNNILSVASYVPDEC